MRSARKRDQGVERESVEALATLVVARPLEQRAFVRLERGPDLGGGVDRTADVDAPRAVGIGPRAQRTRSADALVARGFVGTRGGLHPRARGAEPAHTVVRGAFEEFALRGGI